MAELIIIKPEDKARRIVLTQKELFFGRLDVNDIVIPDPNVSGRNSKIYWERATCSYVIQDLNSKNGTLVNRNKILKLKLKDNDIIQIGTHILKYYEQMDETTNIPPSGSIVTTTIPAPDSIEDSSGTCFDLNPPDFIPDMRAAARKKDFACLYFSDTGIGKSGNYVLLDKENMIVGSDDASDLVLKQPIISARHAIISRIGGTYFIKDNKSKNGVYVNGNKIVEHQLSVGDIISIGHENLRFAGSPFVQETVAPQNKTSFIPILVTILILVSLAGGSYLGYRYFQQSQRGGSDVSNEMNMNESHYNNGCELFDQLQWENAIESFTMVTTQGPYYDDALVKIDSCNAEITNRKNFEEFRALLNNGDLPQATSKILTLPSNSVYHKEAVSKLEETIREFEVISKPDPEQNTASESLIPEKTTPDDSADPRLLLSKAQQLYNQSADFYSEGKIQAAISSLNSISILGLPEAEEILSSARTRKELIQKLNSMFQEGSELFEKGIVAEAVKKWTGMLEEEKNIVEPYRSSWYKDVVAKITSFHCTNAEKNYCEGQFLEAYEQWTLALKVNPTYPTAKWGVSELDKEAQKLYAEGLQEETSNLDLARLKWKEIVEIVPPDHEMHKKAKQKLAEKKP